MSRRSGRRARAPNLDPTSVLSSGRWDVSHPDFVNSASQKGVSGKQKKKAEVFKEIDVNEVNEEIEVNEVNKEISVNEVNEETEVNEVNKEFSVNEVPKRVTGSFKTLFDGGNVKLKAEVFQIKTRNLGAGAKGKDLRDITITDISKSLGLLLTEDVKETRLYNDVYFKADFFFEPIVRKIYGKVCMRDISKYGIFLGLKITACNGDSGKVISIKNGDIHIRFKDYDKIWTVLEVLKFSDSGQEVVSLEEDQRKFVLFLCSSYVIVHVHVANFVNGDSKMRKKNTVYTDLQDQISKSRIDSDEYGKYVKELSNIHMINPLAWKSIRDIPLYKTVHKNQISKDVDVFSKKLGSFLEVIGMEKYKNVDFDLKCTDSLLMGILAKDLVLKNKCGTARGIVDSVVKSLQESFRLGRFTSLPSAFIPIIPEELPFLLDSLEFGRERVRKESIKELSKYHGRENLSMATKSVLGPELRWYPSLPLGSIPSLSRKNYDLLPTSLNQVYAKIGRHHDIVKLSMVGESYNDLDLFSKVSSDFNSIQNKFRMEAAVHENKDGQFGDNRKIKRGRMFEYSENNLLKFNDVTIKLSKNAILPVTDKVPDRDYEMCKDILVKNIDDVEKRVDEAHLYTKPVQDCAQRLMEKGITCADISKMTAAIFINDSVSSSSIRPQDRKRLSPKFLHFDKKGFLIDILPDDCKNDVTLLKEEQGMTCKHQKHETLVKGYVISIVLGRAIFKLNGFVPDDVNYPLDSRGVKLKDHSREKLFRDAGQNFLGIPNFGENISRTFQLTFISEKHALNKGTVHENNKEFERAVKQMRTSLNVGNKYYNCAVENNEVVQGTSILDMAKDMIPSIPNKIPSVPNKIPSVESIQSIPNIPSMSVPSMCPSYIPSVPIMGVYPGFPQVYPSYPIYPRYPRWFH